MNLDELERLLAVYNKHRDDSTSSVWQKLERMIAARIDLETALRNSARELIADARLARKLHASVCNAVGLLNCCPEVARFAFARDAHTILRQALVDYADAAIAQEQK